MRHPLVLLIRRFYHLQCLNVILWQHFCSRSHNAKRKVDIPAELSRALFQFRIDKLNAVQRRGLHKVSWPLHACHCQTPVTDSTFTDADSVRQPSPRLSFMLPSLHTHTHHISSASSLLCLLPLSLQSGKHTSHSNEDASCDTHHVLTLMLYVEIWWVNLVKGWEAVQEKHFNCTECSPLGWRTSTVMPLKDIYQFNHSCICCSCRSLYLVEVGGEEVETWVEAVRCLPGRPQKKRRIPSVRCPSRVSRHPQVNISWRTSSDPSAPLRLAPNSNEPQLHRCMKFLFNQIFSPKKSKCGAGQIFDPAAPPAELIWQCHFKWINDDTPPPLPLVEQSRL